MVNRKSRQSIKKSQKQWILNGMIKKIFKSEVAGEDLKFYYFIVPDFMNLQNITRQPYGYE